MIRVTLLVFIFLTSISNSYASEYKCSEHSFIVNILADDLDYPWGMDFLPNNEVLVTQKSGSLIKIDQDGKKTKIKGAPTVVYRRQGGLLDVAVDPEFEENNLIYLSYVGRGQGGTGTEVARATLKDNKLDQIEVIFVARPKMRTDIHFGGRLKFTDDKSLLITLGDRGKMDEAQSTRSHHGSLIRIQRDGSAPASNPLLDTADAHKEIYSFGHRNIQGIDLHPETNEIWLHEHGPKGGDELNIAKAGKNYGWPAITYGIDYDNTIISNKTHAEGMEQPLIHWTPSIAPSGMSFYTGDKFPNWRGDIFLGALAGSHIRRLELDDNKVIKQETLLEDLEMRFRDVKTSPDGYIYILTDSHDGHLIRLEPLP